MQDGLADLLLRHRLAQPLALATVAVLAFAVLWLVARLVWLALGFGAAAVPASAPVDLASAPPVATQPLATQPLATWHLFGNALPATDPRSAAAAAPDTALQLTLRGIAAQDDPKAGRAIIADAEGREQVYGAGKEVASGVTIDAVYADRVMLSRNGALEVLRLPRPDEAAPRAGDTASPLGTPGVVAPSPGSLRNTAPATPGAANPGASAGIAAITGAPAIPAGTIDWNAATAKLGVDPRELAKNVQVVPVIENGRFAGVRFAAGGDHPALAKLGLRPDDIVTQVNGIPLDNFSRAQAVSDSLANSRTLNVTVKRGDKTENLSVSLD